MKKAKMHFVVMLKHFTAKTRDGKSTYMVLCLESGFLLGSKADRHQLKKDPEEILVIPVE